MCNKGIDTYASAIQFVPDRYKAQEMCGKAVDTCPFIFDSVPDRCDVRFKKCVIKLFS